MTTTAVKKSPARSTTNKGVTKVATTTPAKKTIKVRKTVAKPTPAKAPVKAPAKKTIKVRKSGATTPSTKSAVPQKVTAKRTLSTKKVASASTGTFTPYRFYRSLIASGVDRLDVILYCADEYDKDGKNHETTVLDINAEFIKVSCVFRDDQKDHVVVNEVDDEGLTVKNWYDDVSREDAVKVVIENYIQLHNATVAAQEAEAKAKSDASAKKTVAKKAAVKKV